MRCECVCVSVCTLTYIFVCFCRQASWRRSVMRPKPCDSHLNWFSVFGWSSEQNNYYSVPLLFISPHNAYTGSRVTEKRYFTPPNLRLSLPSITSITSSLTCLSHPNYPSLFCTFPRFQDWEEIYECIKLNCLLFPWIMISETHDYPEQEHSRCTRHDTNMSFSCLFHVKRISSLKSVWNCYFSVKQASSSCLPHTPRGWGPSRSRILPLHSFLSFPPTLLPLWSFPFNSFPSTCLPPSLLQTPVLFRQRSGFKPWRPPGSSLQDKSLLQKFSIP